MTPAFSEALLAQLSDWATAQFGLRFPPDRWNELARGVASAALELGIPDLEGWAEQLVTQAPVGEQVAAVANHLTISETYFFRHRETFTALDQEILPERIAARRQQARTLRIWSAGCASGEEPYSVAIFLRWKFPSVRPESVAIAGTDINSRVLARARRAVYSEWSFRDVSDEVKERWFHRLPNGRLEVRPEIRQMVHFEQLNLAAPLFPAEFGERGDFDLILCRNVLMYFSAEWQERIIRRLTQALTPEGWMIVGPCDIGAAQAAGLLLQSDAPGIFRKGGETKPRRETAKAIFVPPLPVQESVEPAAPQAVAAIAAAPRVEPAPLVGEPGALTIAATEAQVASAAAQSHANRGELDQALAACDAAIASDKTNASYHYLRACILQEQHRMADAAEAFRRVLFLDPQAVMAEFALGCLAEREGGREQARHHFAVVLRLLASGNRGDLVPGGDGLTVARMRAVVERNLADDAA